MSGERQQVRLLLGENLGDGAGVITGPRTLMRDLVAPVESLAVEIGQGGEGTGGEETVTDVLDGALHAAFFIAPRRAAGTSGEMVVGGEFEEAGMEVNGIAAAFQDHAAEIVGQNGSRRPTPIGEGMDVAEEKILQALVEEELQPQGAAVGESEDEADKRRRARPMVTSPKCAQSACACSPGKVRRRRKASRWGGRNSATTRRSWLTLPG